MSVYNNLKEHPGPLSVEETIAFSKSEDHHWSCKSEFKKQTDSSENKIHSIVEEETFHSVSEDQTVNVKVQDELSPLKNQPNSSIEDVVVFSDSKDHLSYEIEEKYYSTEPTGHTDHNAPEDEKQLSSEEKAVHLVNEDKTVNFNVKEQIEGSVSKNASFFSVKDNLDISESEGSSLNIELKKTCNSIDPTRHTDQNYPEHEIPPVEEDTVHPINQDQTDCSYFEEQASYPGGENENSLTKVKTVCLLNEAKSSHCDTELHSDSTTFQDQPSTSGCTQRETFLEFLRLTTEEKYSNFPVMSPPNDSDSSSSLEDEHRVGYWHGGPTPPPTYEETVYPELHPPPHYDDRKYGQRPPFVATLWFCMMAFMYIMDVSFSPWEAPTLVKCGFFLVWIFTFYLAEIMYLPEMIFNI